MKIHRSLAGTLARARRSVLLLGPRQTGKSTLIRSLAPGLTIDLSDEETHLEFLRQPGLLKQAIGGHKTVFIDEVQRIPSLLNTVQHILDHGRSIKFYLTGSSARKLRRGKANLLPGRLFTYELGPLTCSELDERFDPALALRKGLLPGIYTEQDPETWKKLLRTYATTYLREEVQAEALTRNLEGFSRFFDVICAMSGDFIDFTKFASRAAIERMTARRYFDVLIDTLVVRSVEPFSKAAGRRLVQHPRYYLFDVGVLNGSLRNFEVSADRAGRLFEHLVLQLIMSEAAARDIDCRVSVYRTDGGAEVDFIVELGASVFAVEVKCSRTVAPTDLRGLQSFGEFYGRRHTPIVVYRGDRALRIGDVEVLPIGNALARLGFAVAR